MEYSYGGQGACSILERKAPNPIEVNIESRRRSVANASLDLVKLPELPFKDLQEWFCQEASSIDDAWNLLYPT